MIAAHLRVTPDRVSPRATAMAPRRPPGGGSTGWQFVRAAVVSLVVVATRADAAPVPGREVAAAWTAPAVAQEIDAATAVARPFEWTSPSIASPDKWLAGVVSPGQAAWLHVDGDGPAVRVAWLVLAGGLLAAADAEVIARGPHDFEVMAPAGPPVLLGVRAARSGPRQPAVQLWIGHAPSLGLRWEQWDDEIRTWATNPAEDAPPPPPADVGDELVARLATLSRALAAAGAEDGRGVILGGPIASLLRAEAVLEAAPYREPVFPFAWRVDDTEDVAGGRPRQQIADETWMAVTPASPVTFSGEGTGAVRIEARADLRAAPRARLALALRSGGRVLASFAEDVAREAGEPRPLWSPVRYLVAPAPPGRHSYTVSVAGASVWIRVTRHLRRTQVGDFVTHAEDVSRLLGDGRGQAWNGLAGSLLAAEAAWLDYDAAAARRELERVAAVARTPVVRAFAVFRLAELTPDTGFEALARRAADTLGEADPGLADLIALARVQRHLLAGDEPAALAVVEARPSIASRFATWAGPAYLRSPAPRSPALAALELAAARHPLDRGLQRAFQRAWEHDTRWAALAPTAAPVEESIVAADPGETCEQVGAAGARGFTAVSSGDHVALHVPLAAAPPGFLQRTQLLVMRALSTPSFATADIELDGATTRVPLLEAREPIPIALAQGSHQLALRADHATALVPCELVPGEAAAGYFARRVVSLTRGSVVFALQPSTMRGVVGLELEVKAGAPGVRLILRAGTTAVPVDVVAPAHPTTTARAIVVTMPVAASTSRLIVERIDGGPAVAVRALVRRSSGPATVRPRRRAPIDAEPVLLGALESATLSIRAAPAGASRSRARLVRAGLLLDLDAPTAASRDLALARAALSDDDRARAEQIEAELASPPLVMAVHDERAVVLTEGAGLPASGCAGGPGTAQPACDEPVASYLRARAADRAGDPGGAAAAYRAAYAASLLPSLARAAALRYAQVQTTESQLLAFVTAKQAAMADDPDGPRVVRRVRAGSRYLFAPQSGGARAFDGVELVEQAGSVRERLAAPPWPARERLCVTAGHAASVSLDLTRPAELVVEAFCDVLDTLSEAPERCGVTVNLDGRAVAQREAASGARAEPVALALPVGPHRLELVVESSRAGGLLCARATSSRPIGEHATRTSDDRFALNDATERRARRVVATAAAPAVLRIQGPTVVQLDVLMSAGVDRSLAVIGADTVERVAVCRDGIRWPGPPFDCHDVAEIVLPRSQTYTLRLTPAGAAEAAVVASRRIATAAALAGAAALAIASSALDAGTVAEAGAPVRDAPADNALTALAPPLGGFARALGTLQVQALAVFGDQHAGNPQIGDRFEEIAVSYRRKLDGVPIWLLGAGALRLRDGPSSQGLEVLGFTRFSPLQLRYLANVRAFTQSVAGHQAYAVTGTTYLERSFEVTPRLYVLPRLALEATYQSLAQRAALVPGTAPAPVDPMIFDRLVKSRPRDAYGQLLVWWVPFVNMIAYAHGRLSSGAAPYHLDRSSVELGADVALGTTEIITRLGVTRRAASAEWLAGRTTGRFSSEVAHTVWLDRNHRVTGRASVARDLDRTSYAFFVGLFWEGSFGRGLDDYATPEINLPYQLAQGRGVLEPARELR